MAELKVNDCKAKFGLKRHYEAPGRLSYVKGKATHPTYGEVATLTGLALTNRYAWRQTGDFMSIMEAETEEMTSFSTQVFDNDMNLLTWLADGGHRSGTGCWGAELSKGDIIYVQDITVKPQFRGHGIGTWLLQQFLKSPQAMNKSSSHTHVFCWPLPAQGMKGTEEQAVSFFHKSGFRRLARTPFFCYSSDPNHPSHKIAIADDATLPASDFVNHSTLTPGELEAQFPLHVGVASVKTPEIARAIRAAHAVDPSAIHKKSPNGLTLVHIAATARNLYALRTLLELDVSRDLQDSANSQGMTPLEALDESMRSDRLYLDTVPAGTPWNGYSVDELTCQYLLKKALNTPELASSEAEYIAQHRLGCSCGQCTNGWLSGRMRFLLSVSAMATHNTGMTEVGKLHGSKSVKEYLDTDIMSMRFLPPTLYNLLNERFCKSWFQTFRAVRDVLNANGIPSHPLVALLPGSIAYIEQGGRVEYVLDSITNNAKDQLNDGSFAKSLAGSNANYQNIPSCANDSRFDIVREKLGLLPQQYWGPYYDIELDEMDDYESFDEDSDPDLDNFL